MKKLIFLLILAVVLCGFMSAQNIAHPPGALTLDVELPGYGIYETVITPDTDSADMLFIEHKAGYLASPDLYIIYIFTGKPQRYPLIKPIMVIGKGVLISTTMTDFHLRL